jgi:predicted nucleic acid-binding Zn ribbon protein
VLKDAGLTGPDRQMELTAAWRDVAGPRIADETGISSFRGGVLTIDVGSAPLKHELEVFQREELLAALRERLSGTFVSELRFNLK